MQNNSASVTLYNLLVTRDFEPEILDRAGKPVTDPSEAELFSFDWKTPNKNYGTVVALLGDDQDLQLYYGDNLGQTMEGEDKKQWFDFLHQMKKFATSNLLDFSPQDINRLKYTMQGMAAIKEGLFEGYYGTRKISYSDQPKKTRLMIRHNRDLDEGDARYRAIESLFVETADGERFKVPSRSLTHGRMLARHVAEGGTPYDAFGQHITEIVREMATLSRFMRAARGRDFNESAQSMIEAAVRHYSDLKAKAKRMVSQRGYHEEREAFDPAEITETEQVVDKIRTMFVEQNIDQRIEEALPILARLVGEEEKMKEINEFESWTNEVTEGTWTLPNTPDKQRRLQELMSQELIVGPDATNATEQLYDLVGDDALFDMLEELAYLDPDANAWDDPKVMARLAELGVSVPAADVQEALQGAPLGGALQMPLNEQEITFEPVKPARSLDEGDIHELGYIDFDLLPGAKNLGVPRDDYSDTLYYRDPISGGVFSFYYAHGAPRIRGTGGMDEARVAEIVQTLEGSVEEDLDCDGVMMTRPSNMSSESIDRSEINRLIELAKI
jgi:hypothetical protein